MLDDYLTDRGHLLVAGYDAAVLARELGIPAVVGAAGALELPDGATVEVDPRMGSVRVVA